MKQSNQRSPWIPVSLLLLIGACASAFAFWLVDHRQTLPNSDVVVLILMGMFFASFTTAFVLYLRWRDKSRATRIHLPLPPDPNLSETIYGLTPGREYRVLKSFTDHYGNVLEQGARLRFKQRHFLPYHGGHTVVFEEQVLYLQEDQNGEILDHFAEYIALIED